MASQFRVLAIAGLLLGVAAAQTVRADTITITSGGATVAWDDPSFFNLYGDNFQLLSGFLSVPVSPQDTCFSGCAPGTHVNLTTTMGGSSGNQLGQAQVAVINGVPFTSPSDPDTWLHLTGQLMFDAPDVIVPALPVGDPATAFLMAPFVLHGQLAGFPEGGNTALFQVDLTGRGTARLRLVGFEGLWRFPEVTYSFENQAPVPEPATMLLLAGGLGGLLFRCRHNRRG